MNAKVQISATGQMQYVSAKQSNGPEGLARGFMDLVRILPFNDAAAVERAFEAHPDSIAAVIVEPYPGNMGLVLPRPGYLQRLRELCTRYAALLIFDEVMTGFRVGRGGAQEREDIVPDLTTLGKVIGGGLPAAAFGGRADVMAYLSPDGPVYQAGTLSGNPLAMAAGLAQLRELERVDGWGKLENIGQQLESGVRRVLQRLGRDYQFHRLGSMFCLLFTEKPVWSFPDAMKSDLTAFRKFFHCCLQRGVYFAPSQFETGFLCLMHSAADVDQTADVVDRCLRLI